MDPVQKHYGVPPSGMGGNSGRLYVYNGLCFIYGCCFVGCGIAKTVLPNKSKGRGQSAACKARRVVFFKGLFYFFFLLKF